MTNQGNMTPPKVHNHFSENDPKETEICDFSNEFNVVVFSLKFSELQENTDRQVNEIRTTIYEQSITLNREVEIIEKNQTEILELKNTTNEMENVKESINKQMKESVKYKTKP